MTTEIIFKNSRKFWTTEEDEKLDKLYNKDMLDIIEISKIHERAPGGIISRLIKNNIIDDKRSVKEDIIHIKKNLYTMKILIIIIIIM
jgi:hypothetical protein